MTGAADGRIASSCRDMYSAELRRLVSAPPTERRPRGSATDGSKTRLAIDSTLIS